MTVGFIGLLCTALGVAVGWLLRSEDVWERDNRIRDLANDLAYATGHPVAASRDGRSHVRLVPGQRR